MSRLFKNLKNAVGGGATGESEKNAPASPGVAKKTAAGATVAPAEKPAAVPLSERTVLLFAWKAAALNPKLLTAYRPGTDPTNPNNLVTVNVRENRNFTPHMRLKVTATAAANVFDFVGPLPRWRGKY